MTLEIVGNTINGSSGGDYAIEIANLWTQADAEANGYVFVDNASISGGPAVTKGMLYVYSTTGGHMVGGTHYATTPDLLPLLSRTNICFQGSIFIASAGINNNLTDSYQQGHIGTGVIRLTDGTNSSNLLYAAATALAVFSSSPDQCASSAMASGMITLSLTGNIVTITIGGLNTGFSRSYNGSNSVSPIVSQSSTKATDGSTIDISSWSSLKVQCYVSEGVQRTGGHPGISFATISPIILANSKIGSNKTQ